MSKPKRRPIVQREFPEAPDFDLELPAKFTTEEFVTEWREFCEHRVEMSTRRPKPAPWTERAAKAILRKLSEHDVGIAVSALRTAIAGSYQGVFPESVKSSGSKPKRDADSNLF